MCMCTGELRFEKEKSVNKAILKFNLRVYFLLCCLFSPGDRSVCFSSCLAKDLVLNLLFFWRQQETVRSEEKCLTIQRSKN